jgi:hypothetical protein
MYNDDQRFHVSAFLESITAKLRSGCSAVGHFEAAASVITHSTYAMNSKNHAGKVSYKLTVINLYDTLPASAFYQLPEVLSQNKPLSVDVVRKA